MNDVMILCEGWATCLGLLNIAKTEHMEEVYVEKRQFQMPSHSIYLVAHAHNKIS